MWVARFKLQDDKEDIHSPLCVKHSVEFYAVPLSYYRKDNTIHAIAGGTLSGSPEQKKAFVNDMRKDKRVASVEQHHDFVIIHATHHASREARRELAIFYDPQFIHAKPIHVASDGWEYWEVACVEREPLNKLVQAAKKHYRGALFSIRQETLTSVTSLELTPELTAKQLEALQAAYKAGYYTYPRKLTIPDLAKRARKSYATFQEHMRKAENKLIAHFLKYR